MVQWDSKTQSIEGHLSQCIEQHGEKRTVSVPSLAFLDSQTFLWTEPANVTAEGLACIIFIILSL
jgi:hypothetical protein